MSKYGVKVAVIDELDYEDFRKVLDAIKNIGFEIKIVDNGNAVCQKENVEEKSK